MADKTTFIGDYIEPGYVSHGTFLDEETYSTVLDSIVFVCVDIMATHKGEVLLARRTRHPQKDWWVFGGRMKTGETLTGAGHRLLAAEIGLDIAEERLKYLLSFSAAWKTRAHEPASHGSHNVSMMFTFELTDREVKELQLNDEYSDSKFVTLTDILEDQSYHPAMHQCARALGMI